MWLGDSFLEIFLTWYENYGNCPLLLILWSTILRTNTQIQLLTYRHTLGSILICGKPCFMAIALNIEIYICKLKVQPLTNIPK